METKESSLLADHEESKANAHNERGSRGIEKHQEGDQDLFVPFECVDGRPKCAYHVQCQLKHGMLPTWPSSAPIVWTTGHKEVAVDAGATCLEHAWKEVKR